MHQINELAKKKCPNHDFESEFFKTYKMKLLTNFFQKKQQLCLEKQNTKFVTSKHEVKFNFILKLI